ncbi:MAG: pantothenate kinase, partial [Flavobacteriales bacterium]|nr:pantothenate kinase [Flavobacteriales bacterium]
EKHGDFKIILTGGDTAHLSKRLKSAIFAKPNYLLESLYVILKHNIKTCESL